MPTTKSFGGVSYDLPNNREPKGWGADLAPFLQAVADKAITLTGGSYVLTTADIDFGDTYGLIAPYFKSGSSNIATAGILRLANNEGIGWRNAANSADLILKVDAGNALEYNGNDLATAANNLSFFAATTSAQLAALISDETGSGALVFATSPTLVTPNIGVATATSVNKVTFTAPATGSTLTIADGKTLTVSNTLTFTGTDASSVAFGTGGTVVYSGGTLAQFAATTSAQLAGVISDETGSGALVFANTPTLVTPVLGVATATSINKVTFTAPATGSTLTLADGKTLTVSNTLTFTGTDASSVAFGTGGTVVYSGGTLAQFAATTSAQLAGVISDETGSGSLVFATSPSITTPTFVTSATGPLFIGGTGAGSSLTLQSTSGVGTTDQILFKVGNNGATGAGSISTAAAWVVGPASGSVNHVVKSNAINQLDIDQDGVKVRGRADGAAAAAGYLGEIQETSWTGQTINTGAGTTLASAWSVTKGIYIVLIGDYGNKGAATVIVGSIVANTATISITLGDSGYFQTTVDGGASWSSAYFMRVTGAGTIDVKAVATTGSASSHAGRIQLIRVG